MKKIYLAIFVIFATLCYAYADDNEIQTRIDNIGTQILNYNKIQDRVIFTYDNKSRKSVCKTINGIRKNQIIVYDKYYKYAETDDELASALARKIFVVVKVNNSRFDSRVQVTSNPKFYELIIDKKAVDYMVNANYNPLGLITYLNKTVPEYKRRFFARHNPTKDRLMEIYEYIAVKYPQYIQGAEYNEYGDNPYYQNFLLNTVTERQVLRNKLIRMKENEN